jgi:hypothetical protein
MVEPMKGIGAGKKGYWKRAILKTDRISGLNVDLIIFPMAMQLVNMIWYSAKVDQRI